MSQSDSVFDFLITELQNKKSAFLNFSQKDRPVQGHRIVIDLGESYTKDRPMEINTSFRSIFIESATDVNSEVFLRPITKEESQPIITFHARDSWAIDYQIPKCFLHWDVQPGKTMTLVFFPDSEFRSGSQISVNSGGVSLNDGASLIHNDVITLPATTPTLIAPVNFARKVSNIQNDTGGELFVGGSTVSDSGLKKGIGYPHGAVITWRNTSALYAYSVSGGAVIRLDEE